MFVFAFVFCFLEAVNTQTCKNKIQNNFLYADDTQRKLSFGVRILDRFLEFQPVSLWTCVEECMRRKGCRSFNYFEKMNYCELNYKKKNSGSHDTSKAKNMFVQSDKSTWKKQEMHFIGNCSDHKCDEKYKCNTSGLCEISDCGEPPDANVKNYEIIGQGDHRIGNGVFIRCKEPFVMRDNSGAILPEEILAIKCNTNGDWEFPTFTCDDMLVFDSHWYYFSAIELSWKKAKTLCREMNFHLLKIDNIKELDWTVNEIVKREKTVWTGGNDREQNGEWVWEADNTPVNVTNWHSNQPDSDEQHCMDMKEKWGDNHCGVKLKFVCEQWKL